MDRIFYAGDTVFTGSDIARALLAYASALAQNNASDTVRIPIYDESGERGESEFLIGPASQIAADTVARDWEELVDEPLVERLTVATRALGAPKPAPVTDADPSEFPDFGEL